MINGKIVLREDAKMPSKEKGKASCYDLFANIEVFKRNLLKKFREVINTEDFNKLPKGITKDVIFEVRSGTSRLIYSYTYAELLSMLGNILDGDKNFSIITDIINNIVGIVIPKSNRCLIPTGVHIQLEDGYDSLICPRSGKGLQGVSIELGTIDNDYTGDLGINVKVHSSSETMFAIKHNDAIAQLRITKVYDVDWEVVKELEETIRGSDGFGSTDKK